jgi:hypothetical protein
MKALTSPRTGTLAPQRNDPCERSAASLFPALFSQVYQPNKETKIKKTVLPAVSSVVR